MEFSLLNLKDFGTLFPNKIINAVEYEGVINQYINDKLSVVKNINGLSGNELDKKIEWRAAKPNCIDQSSVNAKVCRRTPQ